ncbi:MAG TPA: DUF1330 domain-containing protein [Anaerolineae bacterium]|nr:DUF1330 domain-containing protein [Anaerolineae bacterium]
MSAYVVVEIDVHDPEQYETYKQMAPSSIAAHGGRYLVRGGQVETLEGTWLPKRLVILEFPSLAQAKDWLSSTEYAEAKALRRAITRTQMIVVEGL